jgi:hypothetical protein
MKRLFFFMLVSVSFIGTYGQTVSWAKKGGLWAYDYGYGIANDRAGNVYVAGKYEQNANFSGVNLPCQGNHDMYVAQYSPSGNLNWIRTAGGPSGDYAHALTCDGNYVYVAGEAQGSNSKIIFPGSSITLTTKNNNDVMLAKYSLSGTLLWAKRGGGYDDEKGLGISTDANGNVFVCGFYRNTTTFGSTTLSGAGDNDIFIAKYDPNGNFLWVQKAAGPGRDEAKSIKCDVYGNVYISGLYSNGCKFGSTTLSASGYEMFLAKYSSNGSLVWVKRGGGSSNDVGWALSINSYNELFVGGEFGSSANFGGITVNSTGAADIFVAKYDLNGNVKWVKKAGGYVSDRARGLTCAGSNVYITGQYGKTVSFGPFQKTAADNSDIFTACLDNTGNFKWVSTAGGAADAYEDLGYESGNAICAETNGNVYSTGSMLNGATFGSTSLSAYSRTDMFIVKILSSPTRSEENDQLAEEEQTDSSFAERADVNPEMLKEVSLNVYPNPGDGHFIMELNANENLEYELFVYNSLGQIVETKKIIAPVTTALEMSGREKGIYIIEVRNAAESYRRKVVLR